MAVAPSERTALAHIHIQQHGKELSRQDGQACEPGDLSLALQMAPVQQVPTHASTNEPAEPEASLIVTDRRRKHLRRSRSRGELIGEV